MEISPVVKLNKIIADTLWTSPCEISRKGLGW